MTFLYLRDPLFLSCFLLYALNRTAEHFGWGTRLTESYLNDLICIPFLLPILLYGQRVLKLRHHDRPPTILEILVPTLVWAWMFEVYLPATELWRGRAVADPFDVVCYVAGGVVSWIYWQQRYSGKTLPVLPANEPACGEHDA